MAPHLGVPYQPANLHETLGTLMILGVLLYLRRLACHRVLSASTYLVSYPISQLIVFYWRIDYETPAVLWGLKQAQLTALAMLAVVVPPFVVAWLRSRRAIGESAAMPASAAGG